MTYKSSRREKNQNKPDSSFIPYKINVTPSLETEKATLKDLQSIMAFY